MTIVHVTQVQDFSVTVEHKSLLHYCFYISNNFRRPQNTFSHLSTYSVCLWTSVSLLSGMHTQLLEAWVKGESSTFLSVAYFLGLRKCYAVDGISICSGKEIVLLLLLFPDRLQVTEGVSTVECPLLNLFKLCGRLWHKYSEIRPVGRSVTFGFKGLLVYCPPVFLCDMDWEGNADCGRERMHLVSSGVSACCVSDRMQTMLCRCWWIQYCVMTSFSECHYTSSSSSSHNHPMILSNSDTASNVGLQRSFIYYRQSLLWLYLSGWLFLHG